MADYDWTRFVVRINVNADPAELYSAWATRAGIERWFLRVSEYRDQNGNLVEENAPVKNGDTYKWHWHGWADDTVENGRILEADGNARFGFSFGEAGDCTVKIYTEQSHLIVELTQEHIPDDERGRHYWHLGCKTGWTFFLSNLKSIYEGGIDLRNKNVALQRMLNK